MDTRATLPRQILVVLTLVLAILGSPLIAPALAASPATVTHGGNLRSAPRVALATVIGQVCPGDSLSISQTSTVSRATWYYGTITATAADCDPSRVAAGTAGWLSASLVRLGAPAPAPTATPAQAGVVITEEPGSVRRGAMASVAARAAPRQPCEITVRYKSGPSRAAGLVPKTTDASGDVAWSWKVGTRTTPGSWPVIITCGRSSATTYVIVP